MTTNYKEKYNELGEQLWTLICKLDEEQDENLIKELIEIVPVEFVAF